MAIFGKSRDLKTKTSKTPAAYIFFSMKQKPKYRVHSDPKTDVRICWNLRYWKSYDVTNTLRHRYFLVNANLNKSLLRFLHLNALYLTILTYSILLPAFCKAAYILNILCMDAVSRKVFWEARGMSCNHFATARSIFRVFAKRRLRKRSSPAEFWLGNTRERNKHFFGYTLAIVRCRITL